MKLQNSTSWFVCYIWHLWIDESSSDATITTLLLPTFENLMCFCFARFTVPIKSSTTLLFQHFICTAAIVINNRDPYPRGSLCNSNFNNRQALASKFPGSCKHLPHPFLRSAVGEFAEHPFGQRVGMKWGRNQN
jgi:hypothetical protein